MTPTPQQIDDAIKRMRAFDGDETFNGVRVEIISFALLVLRMLVDEPGELRDKLLEQAGA